MKYFYIVILCLLSCINMTSASETIRVTNLSSPELRVQRNPIRMIMGNIVVQAPETFEKALFIAAPRDNAYAPGMGYSFTIDKPATVYIAVHRRGKPTIPPGWEKAREVFNWGHSGHGVMSADIVYRKDFPAGVVNIPPHNGFNGKMYGIPHLTIIPLGTPPQPCKTWSLEELQPARKAEKSSPNGRPLFTVPAGSSFSCSVPAGVLKPGKVYLFSVSGSSRNGSFFTLSANRRLRFPFGNRNRFEKEFSRIQIPFVPDDTDELRFTLSFNMDSAQLEAPRLFEDRNGIRPQEGQIVNYYPSRDWKPLEMNHAVRLPKAGSALDFSQIAAFPPIGKEDRIIINNEGKCAVRKNPTHPLRFRSAVMQFVPDPQKIANDIKQLKQLGINLVRFHGPVYAKNKYRRFGVTIDQAKMIPQSQEEFREYFDEQKLRAFDYALAELSKNGIYVFWDLMSSYCGWTDALQSGHWVGKDLLGKQFHAQLYVNETFRRNWAEGVKYLLNRVNTVNGRRYADDPVLAFLLFMNEQDFRVSPSYLSAFTPEWEKFYGPGAPKLSEQLLKSDTPAGRKAGEFMQKKIQELTRFYHGVVRSTGCKALLTNWDLYMRMIDAPGRELLEVSTLHTYHGHAGLPLPAKSVPGYPVQTTHGAKEVYRNIRSSLRSNGHYLARILAKQSLNRPVFVTEYADCAPNPYRHEMGLFFSGYAALNGISLLLPHGELLPGDNFRPVAPHNYADFCDPIFRASDAVSAFAFLRGDVAESPHSVEFTVTPEILRSAHRLDALAAEYTMLGFLTRIGVRATGVKPLDPVGNVSPNLSLTPQIFSRAYGTSVEAVTSDARRDRPAIYADMIRRLRKQGVLPKTNRTDEKGTILESDTGELLFEPDRGTLRVVTPRLAGAVLKENRPVTAGAVRIENCSVPASVTLVSLEAEKTLSDANRLLLIFATDAVNCGMATTKDGKRLLALGGAPLLMRTGKLTISLANRHATPPAVYALHLDGSRAEQLPVRQTADGMKLELDTAKLQYGTPFFEILYPEKR